MTMRVTFCGQWAGTDYPGGQEACENAVRNMPQNYTEAYWLINSINVYNKQVTSYAFRIDFSNFLVFVVFFVMFSINSLP